jgi:hypothetical protein
MSSPAARAMWPGLASKEPGAKQSLSREKAGVSAGQAMYGRKEVERKFYNPALVRVPGLKPVKRR